MKNKNYHTVRTDPKSNWKIVKIEAKWMPLTHITVLTILAWYSRHFNKKWQG
jgi:hypothetical protein